MDLDSIDYDLDGLLALVGGTPLERIARAQWAMRVLDDDMRAAVREARAAGDSWATVGNALGMSRQAAHERFRDED